MDIVIIVSGIYFMGCLIMVFCEPILNKNEEADYPGMVILWPIAVAAIIAVLPYVALQILIITPVSKAGKRFFGE